MKNENEHLIISRKLGFDRFITDSGNWMIGNECWISGHNNFTLIFWFYGMKEMENISDEETRFYFKKISHTKVESPFLSESFTNWLP